MRTEAGARCGDRSDRLHNCGPGTREVFVTPAIGEVVAFDLAQALFGWTGWGTGREVLDAWPADGGRVPPTLIATATRRVLAALGEAGPEARGDSEGERARTLLGVLAEALRSRGLLRGLVGLAGHAYANAPARRKLPGRGVRECATSTLEVATTLVAYAVYAPPLLLWTRTPSLRWFRGDVTIELRRLGLSPEPHGATAGLSAVPPSSSAAKVRG